MAKLFYTLEEAAQRLRKSTEEIMAMARSGQLQELKDKDQVLFRRSAIDQLAS
ncbi:MAG: helix-turn-helix domain-containing protein, partial [Phycisphaerae bacterium]|nr:helix-turn-helix domain-containing protein [Phycisphaerae bacterium]